MISESQTKERGAVAKRHDGSCLGRRHGCRSVSIALKKKFKKQVGQSTATDWRGCAREGGRAARGSPLITDGGDVWTGEEVDGGLPLEPLRGPNKKPSVHQTVNAVAKCLNAGHREK
ncbi:hypothetical protein IF2G_06230 [Cordyceps javanica]|nr:hypothetical protein IF2G_06230 [Cordyceps javanica]